MAAALCSIQAVYLALGVMADGTKDILGLRIETSEGTKFWLRVLNELKNRGIDDILSCGQRAEGVSGGDQRSVSRHRGADLHR
jgi:transposase-like protein